MRNNLSSMEMLLKRKSLSFIAVHDTQIVISSTIVLHFSSSSFSISSFALSPSLSLSLFYGLSFSYIKIFMIATMGALRKRKEEQKRKTISTAIECDKKHFSFKLFAISLCHYYVSQSYFVINYSTVFSIFFISVIVDVVKC